MSESEQVRGVEEQEMAEWRTYWDSLSAADRRAEFASMAAHEDAAERDDNGRLL